MPQDLEKALSDTYMMGAEPWVREEDWAPKACTLGWSHRRMAAMRPFPQGEGFPKGDVSEG